MPHSDPTRFLRALLDASPFGVIALDESGHVRLWSRGAQQLLGWREEDVIGRTLPLEAELPLTPHYESEASLVRNDGASIDVEVRTVPWHEGTLAILTDISRHRLAQREIQDL